MDTVQPQLNNRMGGGTGTVSQSRFFQDVYRAVKCPNFSVSRSAGQTFTDHATNWNLIQWDVVNHNYLNCFNVAGHSCRPNVPGLYFMSCQIPFEMTGNRPVRNSLVRLAFLTPGGVVTAECAHEFVGEAFDRDCITYLNLTSLEYLDGKGENAYRTVGWFQNSTGATGSIVGAGTAPYHTSRFQAFKIAY